MRSSRSRAGHGAGLAEARGAAWGAGRPEGWPEGRLGGEGRPAAWARTPAVPGDSGAVILGEQPAGHGVGKSDSRRIFLCDSTLGHERPLVVIDNFQPNFAGKF